MTVTVNHAKTNAISDWTQAQLDEQIALGNFPAGTTLANIVLPSDWNDDHTLTGLGTMAEQNANSVAITGGSVNNTTIGATTASTGTFTTLIGGANVANYGQLTGGATTKAVEFVALGTDSNISIALDSKGTGAIDLAAGSSGVNISNGGTVTAITRTNSGASYTSFPSVAITAPTTSGGVQAVITVAQMFANTATIQAGGTGYTVGNIVTLVGGTPAAGAATYTVSAVSGGVVTAVTPLSFGAYTVLPTSPVSVTGGSGTGLTLNVTYGVQNFTITNAGSGYIEQPTITFSGGGGSGAAAYASVGTTAIVKGLFGGSSATSMQFSTPAGGVLKLMDGGTTATPTSLIVKSGNSSTQLYPDTANSQTYISSSGTGFISFQTNTLAQEQFRVSHTASAVNYVQVTGSATGARPTISPQGSDANISLGYDAKGTGGHTFRAGGNTQVLINNTSTAVNALNLTGSATGTAVPISVTGTDTNIDLALTPKGTGLVRFGTYVAGALTATGYINIKAADGITYKVLVST